MTWKQSTSEIRVLASPALPRKQRLQLRLSERRLVLMAGDAMMVCLAIFIALAIWAWVGDRSFDRAFLESQLSWFFALNLLWFLLASANDYYELALAADRWLSLQRLLAITLQSLVVYLIVFFLSPREALPRLFILYYGIASFILLALSRLLNPALIGWASAPRRALIIGTDWAAHTMIDVLRDHASNAYELLGVVGKTEDKDEEISDVPILSDGEDLLDIVLREGISELIVTSTRELPGEVFQGVMDAYEHGAVITPMPILYERIMERVPVEHVGDDWAVVLPIAGTSVFNLAPLIKRIMDIMLASLGLLIFALLLPFIALALYLDSPGAIFYRQERVGLNGRIFRITKLRTMIPDAEVKTGAVFAQENDPRITRVGRFLRKTRLDEVPQLFTVLTGEMSLIGPRPERPHHVARLQQKIPFYRTRHVIRPGLTGWAQVRYKYGATDEDALVKLQYDLYYIRHQSLLLDIDILLRTVGKVLRMSGQ